MKNQEIIRAIVGEYSDPFMRDDAFEDEEEVVDYDE